jgi:putative transposase
VKFAAIADWAECKLFPVDFMCAELGVSRSGFYAWQGRGPSARASTDADLTAVIKAAYERLRGNPGVRRMHAELRTLGHRLSRKRVWRLMQAAGLQGRHPKAWKRTTVAGDKPVNAPDLLRRNFTAERADERWCGDITYIKTWTGWAYLATVIDLHSRAVVGWAIADHMRTDLVIDALDMALSHRQPPAGVIFHSDRGNAGNTPPAPSRPTAPIRTYADRSAGPAVATTTRSASRSSPPTRKNSYIPGPGRASST